MNPKQLYDHNGSEDTSTTKGRYRRRRHGRRHILHVMGEDVPSRRAFIEDNVLNVAHLDSKIINN